MFLYFDDKIKEYEDNYQWDQSLQHLERMYLQDKNPAILNALVGFSWLYLVEGPIISREYDKDPNILPVTYWKKYVDRGRERGTEDSFFCFICGYTLAMDWQYLGEEYEELGTVLMEKCVKKSCNHYLRCVANHFIMNHYSTKFLPIVDSSQICSQIFYGDSLLDQYFREILTLT